MKSIYPQVEALLETMHEQLVHIKQYENKIPQIELDLLLSNLRQTYEFVYQLNKINQKDTVNLPSINAIPEVVPVPAQKESSFRIKNTSLPFEVPFFNKFKKEVNESNAAESVHAPTPAATTVKPTSGLKLESTTLPPFGPYVTIPKVEVPEISSVKKEALEVAIPEKKEELPLVAQVPIIDEKKQEESPVVSVNFELPVVVDEIEILQSERKEEVVYVSEIKETSVKSDTVEEPSLLFDMPANTENQEALTLAREKIFKEETQVKKTNPLKKIVGLFEDNMPGADVFGESFSILDKFIKKKEDNSLVEKLRHTPISDLRTAVGVNEKFQYINELFGGNYDDYNASIELLNKCKSFTDAEIFIAENIFDKYKWEAENRNVANFMDLVERRFL
jgi:hypothetical protein